MNKIEHKDLIWQTDRKKGKDKIPVKVGKKEKTDNLSIMY